MNGYIVMDKDCANNPLVVTKIHRTNNKLLLKPYLKRKKARNNQSYKPEDVVAAMHAIWRGMSRRKAAKVFNIPRSTLLEKLDGKRPVDASPGPDPFLTKREERELEMWALDMHRRGFAMRTEDLKDMAKGIIERNQRPTSFKNGRPGRSWMRSFMMRHPRVCELSADATRRVSTREEVRQWCLQHRDFVLSSGHGDILEDPRRIFNVDHAEFLFDAATGRLLDQQRSEEPAAARVSPGVECVSVVAAFSASGSMAPLMFVYPLKELPREVVEDFPSGWVGTHSDDGFLTGKCFLSYLTDFRRWLEEEDVRLPVLVLVDGRRSRLNPDVTHYCQEHGLLLYCLFPTPRPAVAELFSALFHDCPEGMTKWNLALRFREALDALDDTDSSGSVFHTYGILPHLQTMLDTLLELGPDVSSIVMKDDFSDCECDYDLMPVEGEIEVEFPSSWDPHAVAALHPELVASLAQPGSQDYVDQPGVEARLAVVPISSPLPETDRRIEEVDIQIDEVLAAINAASYAPCVEQSELYVPPSPPGDEEPFLGFSLDGVSTAHRSFDARCCAHFLEKFLLKIGLLEDFKSARTCRQWGGAAEAKYLFDAWLAANDDCHT